MGKKLEVSDVVAEIDRRMAWEVQQLAELEFVDVEQAAYWANKIHAQIAAFDSLKFWILREDYYGR